MTQEDLGQLKNLLDKASDLFGVDAAELSVKHENDRYVLRVYDRDADDVVSTIYKYDGEKSIIDLEGNHE